MKKWYPRFEEGRDAVWKSQAFTESYVIPFFERMCENAIEAAENDDNDEDADDNDGNDDDQSETAMKAWESVVKFDNTAAAWNAYISYGLGLSAARGPKGLNFVASLYRRAVGRSAPMEAEAMCRSFLAFVGEYESVEGFFKAQFVVDKKMSAVREAISKTAVGGGKRQREEEDVDEGEGEEVVEEVVPEKKQKLQNSEKLPAGAHATTVFIR